MTDAGTHVSTLGALQVGSNNDAGNQDMTNNQAKVLNGGHLTARVLQIGILASGLQNTVTVSGANSLMSLTGEGTEAWIGRDSINNTLIVENGGRIEGRNRFTVGRPPRAPEMPHRFSPADALTAPASTYDEGR